jgi:5-methyltetrahydrofolate--homocysteine methyltransferase
MRFPFLSALERGVVVFDGAMGTSIHACADCRPEDYLGRENCTDILVRSRPDLIQRIHESFLAAGADVVETDSFGSNKLVAAEFDQEMVGWVHDLNVRAARCARAAADKFSTRDRPRFVAGSIGPGTKLITLGQASWESMLDSYREQVRGLLDGGVDCLIVETCQDLLQVKCAVNACLDALADAGKTHEEVPILASVTMETTGTMLLGSDMAAVVNALAPLPIASLGLNCATGPTEMAEHVAYLAKHWDRPFSVIPNAGLPILVDGRTEYPLRPDAFGVAMRRFLDEFGAGIVGGCCGTTADHIRALRETVGTRSPVTRAAVRTPGCSSLYGFTEFRQDNSFLIVAERTNANGSKKFKRLLDESDWDGLVSMAKEEMRDGSHLLDVCVDFVGRDGVRDMAEVASRYVQHVNAPLMVDSTQADVIEAALKRAGGRCIVNSINLEDGERRLDEICPLLRRYGAACVALTIDEDPQAGMAKTADRKEEIAARIHDLYTRKWGLREEDLFFDPLTFTIATGNEEDRRLGLETLEGIERIARRFPRCQILLGLSNISFGLKPSARAVLNSVFLHEARARGLTAAIVHVSKILPQNRIPREQWEAAQWLVFDRRGASRPEGMPESFDPLIHFIGLFPDGAEQAEARRTLADLPVEEALQRHIIDGEDKALEQTLDRALAQYPPLAIINDHLLAGMKVVGDLFGEGKMQLPFVLQSATVMKKAVALLQPHMEKAGAIGRAKARIVLATVSGDVHDIGKNLVDIILTNNGFEVHNIGIKQPLAAMLEAVDRTKADALGMSGLLVKSVAVMEQNLHEMNERGIRVPVLLGGAALTRHYCEGNLRSIYKGPLYYGKDAFEGLSVCDALASGGLAAIDAQVDERLGKRRAVDAKVAASRACAAGKEAGGVASGGTAVLESVDGGAASRGEQGSGGTEGARQAGGIEPLERVPEPPFWGARVVERVPLEEIFPFINTNALFRGQWGLKPGALSADEYEALLDREARPALARLQREAAEAGDGFLAPKVVYGWFPCEARGDDLVVFDPADPGRELERFTFPRQKSGRRLCIADFFRTGGGAGGAGRDVVGFTCVTMGPRASERAKALFEGNRYTEYLYAHGFGVECAEALAELWHKRMRAELGIGHDDSPRIRELFQQRYRGCRYSFGYPACPDMADQEKLWRLLQPERIGCRLTENHQIDPEQSTSALVVHHPGAGYFAV